MKLMRAPSVSKPRTLTFSPILATSAWRVAAALLCFIGGAIALMGRAGGAWVTALGTLLFGSLAATLAILAGDMVRWQADVAASALLLVMTLALFFLRRT
jgi:hypothetical protein